MPPSALWIDDEWRELPEQVEALEASSLEVDCAISVEEGLELIERKSYSVVLLDMILPRVTRPAAVPSGEADNRPFLGLEVIETLARMDQSARPAVVVLTIAGDERLLRALHLWRRKGIVSDVIMKLDPVTFDEIGQVVKNAIKLAHPDRPGDSERSEK